MVTGGTTTTITDRVLTVSHLVKTFGDVTAVNDVSFEIRPGETFGLLGPNGAGKTTIISMVAGLFPPDGGRVDIAGTAMSPSNVQAKRNIGLVPQELAIYPDLSARENLHFFGRLQGLRGKEREARVTEVLDLLGLSDRAKEQTKKFSGGMKRRLNIGIGLLHRPHLLILDEPTVGVDPQSRNSILDAVHRLSAAGTAVLYTTHYMEEAQRLCDRIAILDQGSVQAEGTSDELITLTGGADRIDLEGTGDMAAAAQAIRGIPGVQRISPVGTSGLTLTVSDGPRILASIVTGAATAGMHVTSVQVSRPDLESVFLHLTGKALRD